MEPWVTVAVFMLPSELAVARGLLESEGFTCRTQDEFTVQVHNLYSQAIGGVKLQVQEEEAERAKALLREGGFLHDAPDPQEGRTWLRFVAWSDQVPLLRRLELPIARAMLLVTLVLLVVITPIALASRPTVAELLMGNHWCVIAVRHDGVALQPGSIASSQGYFTFQPLGSDCEETIWFGSRSDVRLPGFGTPPQHGQWIVDRGHLWLHEIDDLNGIYKGPFSVSLKKDQLVLRSDRTVIQCLREQWIW